MLFLWSCRQNESTQHQARRIALSDTAKNRKAPDSLQFIKNTFKSINTGRLDSLVFSFMRDEKTTVKKFYNKGNVVKAVIDWGAVGDAYHYEEFYYHQNKLIFEFDLLEGVGACDNCDFKRETRNYIKNNMVFLSTENGIKKACKVCVIDTNYRAYQILQAKDSKALKERLCH